MSVKDRVHVLMSFRAQAALDQSAMMPGNGALKSHANTWHDNLRLSGGADAAPSLKVRINAQMVSANSMAR